MKNIVENKHLKSGTRKERGSGFAANKKGESWIRSPMRPASWGVCVSIGTFSMGAGLIGALTVTQAILAMVIGCLVIAIALVIIGQCGHKYGIPFTVQLRSSFGTAGIKVPGLLRGIPAIIWFDSRAGRSGGHQ